MSLTTDLIKGSFYGSSNRHDEVMIYENYTNEPFYVALFFPVCFALAVSFFRFPAKNNEAHVGESDVGYAYPTIRKALCFVKLYKVLQEEP